MMGLRIRKLGLYPVIAILEGDVMSLPNLISFSSQATRFVRERLEVAV